MFTLRSTVHPCRWGFSFGATADLARLRDRLGEWFGGCPPVVLREPIAQLVKSFLGGRTRDEVSLPAFERLIRAYPDWATLAATDAAEVESVIAPVTFADVKARRLLETLRLIGAEFPDFDLRFLGDRPVEDALRWLERLPGVGRKVAASTLNFSTLRRPAFVIDTHILRVLRRYGLVGPHADARAAYDAVMNATPDWRARDFAEAHVLLKHLGRTVCRHESGACARCPLRPDCRSTRRTRR